MINIQPFSVGQGREHILYVRDTQHKFGDLSRMVCNFRNDLCHSGSLSGHSSSWLVFLQFPFFQQGPRDSPHAYERVSRPPIPSKLVIAQYAPLVSGRHRL